ncbi:thioredoxin family protein [Sulfurimonas sp.]|uniref:thioredoxin family protein n=1 Tax=Sulfurimonas sp. TaxID=2022749 RepID=UPI003563B93A
MAIFEVEAEDYQAIMDQEFSKGNTVILKFGSEFCEACSALEMELEQLDDMNDNVSILQIDTDQSPEIAEVYDVYQLPTMLIFKNRDYIIHEHEGVMLSEDIQKIIEAQ